MLKNNDHFIFIDFCQTHELRHRTHHLSSFLGSLIKLLIIEVYHIGVIIDESFFVHNLYESMSSIKNILLSVILKNPN